MPCTNQPVYSVEADGNSIYLCSRCIHILKAKGVPITTPNAPSIEGVVCECKGCGTHSG